jgi:hypothetical protein
MGPRQLQSFLTLDGATYHQIDLPAYPSAYVSVPVKMIDMGIGDCRIVAGVVGMRISSRNIISSSSKRQINPKQGSFKTEQKTEPTKPGKIAFWMRFSKFSSGVPRVPLPKAPKTSKEETYAKLELSSGGEGAELNTIQPESGWWLFKSRVRKS